MDPSTEPKIRSAAREPFRWCSRREQYVALAVCRKKADEKVFCRKCLVSWQQIPLPFPIKGA